MKQNIRVLIAPDESSGYNAPCSDLSAYSQGETLEEALAVEGESLAELGFAEGASLLIEVR